MNEDVVEKAKAYFVQYSGPMCFAIDLNPHDTEQRKAIELFAEAKLLQRGLSSALQHQHGFDLRFPLVASQKDFHRTRLSKIPSSRIFNLGVNR